MPEPISPEALSALLGRWANGRGPLYLLLATRLRALIDEGTLPPDTPLPPERRLATLLAVGRGTVVACFDRLREDGYVLRRQGSGTRVASRSQPVANTVGNAPNNPQFLSMFQENTADTVLLACAAPDAPPRELQDAYAQAADQLTTVRGDIGCHPAGHLALREAVAERYTHRGLPTTPDQILVTNGAQQALDLLVRGYVSAGDPVLCENPTYPGALALFGATSAVVRTVPVGGEGVDVTRLLDRFAGSRPVLAYLIPTFHNPTGTVIPPARRRRIAAAALQYDVMLVEDETMADLSFREPVPPPLAAYPGGERVVTVGSLSKVVWGGLRIGWVRADTEVITKLLRLRTLTGMSGEFCSQLAAATLFPVLDDLAHRRATALRHQFEHLVREFAEHLPTWQWVRPQGGQSMWARLPEGEASSYTQVAARHGVVLLPGDALTPGGGSSPWVRVPFTGDRDTLSTAVRRMRAAWGDYSARRPSRTNTVDALII